ncbi:MAG TPA: 50S ribosomal protein L3, partial [Pseudomonadales bacterium]|nr:50S ribosomal protein L3 [Pseudomonadales bacterium]
MSLGLIGCKRGSTRIFTEDGISIPVTVIEVDPNRVTRLKTEDSDGYRAVQVTVGEKHQNRINQCLAGEFKKAGVKAGIGLWEF